MTITDGTMTDTKASFRWLHFSDLHVGVKEQTNLWPRFRTNLLDDLEIIIGRTGHVDLIIFSGDLVQKGSANEFLRFDEIMGEVLDLIGRLQVRPKFITVPGNHDLVRPETLSPHAIALKQFWNNQELRDALWDKSNEEYHSFIQEVFQSYTDWRTGAIKRGEHVTPATTGILPGDASYVIKTESGDIGVIALNSTWLQLGGTDYDGQLHVDARQLLAITDFRPDDWVRRNNVNLLVTHHPAKWLRSTSPTTWANDINPPGRFDLHLFGHMHEPGTATSAHGGGPTRRDMQAASLFGLEKFGVDQHQRIQGYSVNHIEIAGAKRLLRSWPRRLILMNDGRMKLTADNSQDIDELTGSFSIPYSVEWSATPIDALIPIASAHSGHTVTAITPPSMFDLTTIRHAVGEFKAHKKVRRVEQQTCVEALRQNRVVWLASDWGMGHDGFIAAFSSQLMVPIDHIFRLNFSGFVKRDSFFDDLNTLFGASLEHVGEALANAGNSIFIFDDVEVNSTVAIETGVESIIESLATTLADFAPEAFIVIRARKVPRVAHYHAVELKSLDEADVATYARESEIGSERYGKPDAASILFRHTDGIPTRLDAALRSLEIFSLSELISANPDFGSSGTNLFVSPPSLISTVQLLQKSDDPAEKRAYQLLLVLAALPQGERLARLRHFLGPYPLGLMHARVLLNLGLIDTVTLPALDGMPNDSDNKALMVPRPVRDYVRDTIDTENARSIDRKALELYLGEKWADGQISNSPVGRRVRSALCEGYEIQNVITLVVRTMGRAVYDDSKVNIAKSIRAATAFVDALISGDHFRSAAGFCEDVIRILVEIDGFDKELTNLRHQLARSLRMTNRVSEATAILQGLDQSHLTKAQRQNAELHLALCLEKQDSEGAADAARRTIALDKNSLNALQAKSLLAEQIEDDTSRDAELRRLLAIAKRRESRTLTNNIMLALARNARLRGDRSEDLLKQVVQGARTKGDFYNIARAIVALSTLPDAENRLTRGERDHLIEAYHFLYNERLFDLFDQCHAALWKLFERDGDRTNLLNLFRHSSFIWRLNGREAEEMNYLTKLMKNMRDLIAAGLTQANRDDAYFVVRISVVLGGLPNNTLNESPG